MLESKRSKQIISYRRQVRDLTRRGYKEVPSHWYGPDWGMTITDCKIVDGRALFIKLEPIPTPTVRVGHGNEQPPH